MKPKAEVTREEAILQISNNVAENDLPKSVPRWKLVECIRYWQNTASHLAGKLATLESRQNTNFWLEALENIQAKSRKSKRVIGGKKK